MDEQESALKKGLLTALAVEALGLATLAAIGYLGYDLAIVHEFNFVDFLQGIYSERLFQVSAVVLLVAGGLAAREVISTRS